MAYHPYIPYTPIHIPYHPIHNTIARANVHVTLCVLCVCSEYTYTFYFRPILCLFRVEYVYHRFYTDMRYAYMLHTHRWTHTNDSCVARECCPNESFERSQARMACACARITRLCVLRLMVVDRVDQYLWLSVSVAATLKITYVCAWSND